MKVGSLYSNAVDSFAYAAKMLGMEICWQVEWVKEYHRYLNKNYPESEKHYYDGYVGKKNLQRVNIICGGDPCQPHSYSGIRKGKSDDRYRWPEMLRIIGEMRPDWIVNENVVGTVTNMVLDQKITDLEAIGYTCQSFIIPAVSTGACHERNRLFLIAYSDVRRRGEMVCSEQTIDIKKSIGGSAITLDTQGNPFLRFSESLGESPIFPVDDGVSDRLLKLGSAGDSIISTIPIIILGAIREIENIIN